MGDFNAKLGTKSTGDPANLGQYGLGLRNVRGQMLLDFMCRENLYCLSTFYKKKTQKKWTWKSPDGNTLNEIDYVLSNRREICSDVSVLNQFDTGSDHRLVRACLKLDLQSERRKLIRKIPKPTSHALKQKEVEYQAQIQNKLRGMDELAEMSIDDLTEKITTSVKSAVKKVCAFDRQTRNPTLSLETRKLIEARKKVSRTSSAYEALNKKVKKAIRKDSRIKKTKEVLQVIEENKNLKVLRSKKGRGRLRIHCMKDKNGQVHYGKRKILEIIQEFYAELYAESTPEPAHLRSRRREPVQNVGSEEIPEITRSELMAAVKELKSGKCPGEDGIAAEMLKTGGESLEKALCLLLNKCLEEGRIPESWKNAQVVLLFKKGEASAIENYRPISLLSVLYKLLTKLITKRLSNKLDAFQPVEQAGFRKGFSTTDHIQAVRTVIEKCTEYDIPLHIAYVDYQKAFDSIETWAVLEAMNLARVDSRYSMLIKHIYESATLKVNVNDWETETVNVRRGVRQGDSISPKLFTLALESVFQKVDLQEKGLKIDGQYLSHLRFADDIVLFSSDINELQAMLRQLNRMSEAVGLQMNLNKTKVMTESDEDVIVNGQRLEKVSHYIYLGHTMKLGRENQCAEVRRRIQLSWAAFGKLRHVMKNPSVPVCLKKKVFESCILPVMTYGMETVTLNQLSAEKLRVCQRAMERCILGLSLRDRVRNVEIRGRTKLTDAVTKIARQKWQWAGHIARCASGKWTKRLLCWRPRAWTRGVGRPQLRWTDDVKEIAGINWMQTAQSRATWKLMEEAYVQQWTATG
jgi:hypothetical protein